MPTTENPEDQKLALTAEMLRRGGPVCLKARGASMLPSVWPGDLLTIQGAAHDEVVPGDIVLVMRENRFVVHRLVKRQKVQDRFLWITRGDAMPHNDRPEVASELLGRVAGIHRMNRSFVPSRRVSLVHSALAWMLCRWNRLRNLALRIHAARLQRSPAPGGQFLRSVFSEVLGTPITSPSRSSHS